MIAAAWRWWVIAKPTKYSSLHFDGIDVDDVRVEGKKALDVNNRIDAYAITSIHQKKTSEYDKMYDVKTSSYLFEPHGIRHKGHLYRYSMPSLCESYCKVEYGYVLHPSD